MCLLAIAPRGALWEHPHFPVPSETDRAAACCIRKNNGLIIISLQNEKQIIAGIQISF